MSSHEANATASTSSGAAPIKSEGGGSGGGGKAPSKTKKKPPSRQTFTCPDCDKPFSRKEYVERHRRLKHLGIRAFPCESCGSSFARSDLLRRHYKTCKGGGAPHDALKQEEPDDNDMMDHSSTSSEQSNFQLPQPTFTSASTSCAADLASLYSLSLPDLTFPANAPIYPSNGNASGSTVRDFSASLSSLPSLSSGSGRSSAESTASPVTPGYGTDLLTPASHLPYSTPVISVADYGNTAPAAQYGGPPSWRLNAGSGADATLAPSASTFTQEEIMASEVLEDLLRNPNTVGGSRGSAPTTPNVEHDWARPPYTPNQTVASRNNNSTVSVGGITMPADAWSYDPNLGIEHSPAAKELADYFNKGGVGGITALELGFNYEPSLVPDFLLEPQVVHDTDKQFYLPAHKFALSYLYTWHVPPLQKLSQYAAVAASSFLPSIPLIHPGTMVLADMPSHTAFALTVAGAAYVPGDGEVFANEMLVEKRVYLIRQFNQPNATEEDKFSALQSMLLYQLLGLFHREESQRLLSHTFHNALVTMVRQLEVPTKIQHAFLAKPHAGLSGPMLDAVWKEWVRVETWRRVAFIAFLADLETATRFKTPPLLPFSELNIDLPAPDALWDAPSAQVWLQRSLSPATPQPISFLTAIRALLSPQAPRLDAREAATINSLRTASPLPLLILARTLSFLQMKTEEAIAAVDPFRNLYSVVGMTESREREHRDVLARILRGRETLRSLPGGVQRGGGEQWFENVMPTATQASPLSEDAPQPASEDARQQMKRNADTPWFERQIGRARDVVSTEYPEFLSPVASSSAATAHDRTPSL